MDSTNTEKCDLHFHTMISRKLPFSEYHLNSMIGEARDQGIRMVAFTDHIESADYRTVHRYLGDTFDCVDGGYDAFGVRVVPGAEVETSQDVHVLFLGQQTELDELHQRLSPDIRAERFPTVRRLFEMSESLKLLTVWAHPFRFVGVANHYTLSDLLAEELIAEFDAVDFNAKDLYLYGDAMEALLRRAADQLGLPLVAGSDAHHPSQVGSVFNACAERVPSIAGLLHRIETGALEPQSAPNLSERVARATDFKRRALMEASIGSSPQ